MVVGNVGCDYDQQKVTSDRRKRTCDYEIRPNQASAIWPQVECVRPQDSGLHEVVAQKRKITTLKKRDTRFATNKTKRKKINYDPRHGGVIRKQKLKNEGT